MKYIIDDTKPVIEVPINLENFVNHTPINIPEGYTGVLPVSPRQYNLLLSIPVTSSTGVKVAENMVAYLQQHRLRLEVIYEQSAYYIQENPFSPNCTKIEEFHNKLYLYPIKQQQRLK